MSLDNGELNFQENHPGLVLEEGVEIYHDYHTQQNQEGLSNMKLGDGVEDEISEAGLVIKHDHQNEFIEQLESPSILVLPGVVQHQQVEALEQHQALHLNSGGRAQDGED